MEILKTESIFAVTTNTDLTEGRGREYNCLFTERKSTALRMAKGRSVQGSDGRVEEVTRLYLRNPNTGRLTWYYPNSVSQVYPMTDVDRNAEAELEKEVKRKSIIESLKDKLTEEEFNFLMEK